jgi:O-methyltransferase involved in polyketide biosynthesis
MSEAGLSANDAEAPESTAVRVALWRALHVQVDPPPHVLVDELRHGSGLDARVSRVDRRARAVRRARLRGGRVEAAERGARASGTPFVSLFAPAEMLALAHDAGLSRAQHVATATLAARYFAARSDGLRPSSGEDLLVATIE